eukprot:827013-Pelagomonas_calceolata.AAC.2
MAPMPTGSCVRCMWLIRHTKTHQVRVASYVCMAPMPLAPVSGECSSNPTPEVRRLLLGHPQLSLLMLDAASSIG